MTRYERTGWRDQDLSERHRVWGFNCPAVDLDFLMVEYNLGEPVAIVEYKHWRARMPDLRHPTYRALRSLADRTPPLPFMLAFYWPDDWAFRVHPINDMARGFYETDQADMTEQEFVASLYAIRQRAIQDRVLSACKRVTVQEATERAQAA